MDSVIIAAAKYLVFAMVVGFGLVWLIAENRRGKVQLALAAVIGLVVLLVLIKIASASYLDPRPFVPIADGGDGIVPVIPHAIDNGFPSDHSAAAGLMATLVLLRRKWFAGIWFALGALAVAWGRVAAGLHHLLDVGVGLGLGVVAAAIGVVCMTLIVRKTSIATAGPLGRWLAAEPEANITARHRN
ncbi:MAG: phosphatase PAP2 family protein [Nakamurella sp.]